MQTFHIPYPFNRTSILRHWNQITLYPAIQSAADTAYEWEIGYCQCPDDTEYDIERRYLLSVIDIGEDEDDVEGIG